MPHDTDVTQRLAQFVAETKWDALKPPVVHAAKRALMNFFAVALTGCREPAIETALRSLAAFSGGGQAAAIGRSERIDALSAAFLNAASANVLDFCDTHVPTVIHPTAPVAPALLALGSGRCKPQPPKVARGRLAPLQLAAVRRARLPRLSRKNPRAIS